MTIAIDDRKTLRNTLVAYMNGTIATFEFDELTCKCSNSVDPCVRKISGFLYRIHDDFNDHPVSVTHSTWGTLRRIVAFLDTELTISDKVNATHWPFKNLEQWHSNEFHVAEEEIVAYDPAIHACQIHGRFDRIPTLVGFAIIAFVLGLVVVIVAASR